jgi:hypothetical protein
MPYSPISVRQINQGELTGFTENVISAVVVTLSGNQTISGQKTFINLLAPQAGFLYTKNYVNGNYTVNQNDYFICVNASGSQKILTFPQSGFLMGKEYIVKDFLGLSQTNPITLTGSGVTFDYQPSLTISGNFASLYLVGGSGFNYEVN